MITKFVVRESYINSSIRIGCYDTIEKAIDIAKNVYKTRNSKFEVVVEETRYANEKRFNQDFSIDRHVRWASYFNEV